jgi:hypothetical protein
LSRFVILLAAIAVMATSALAQGLFQGTAQEQAACRPDVRKFCSALPAKSSSGQFLSCLQANRAKLSPACSAVLTSHGM